VLQAMGLEPLDIASIDLGQYDKLDRDIRDGMSYPGGSSELKSLIRMAGHIALVLNDIAKTLKRALPPVV